MSKKLMIGLIIIFSVIFTNNMSRAAITEQQGIDVAEFAKRFIEQGNARRDKNGYPLLTYALSGNWNTCIKIRNSGYNEQLYYIKRNGYHIKNGKYIELGNKWCMDCGTYVTYMLKKTLGLELYNGKEPWHVQDIYNDALKGKNSKYFEFVYKSVSVGKIDYSKLQPGDVIARITANGNHGMLYVGDGMIAHANRDMITYKEPAIFGFQVSKLNQYYLSGTVVRVMRIKDGIIPEDLVVNSKLTWPDNGEIVDLLEREEVIEKPAEEIENGVNVEDEENNMTEDTLLNENNEFDGEILDESSSITNEETIKLSGEKLFEKTMKLQENRIQANRIKPFMVHIYQANQRLYKWAK